MTLKLQRALWLWAGLLALVLVTIIPLATWVRVVAALVMAGGAALGWIGAGRRAARRRGSVKLAANASLPPASFRQPVVMVCGDGLAGLFGTVPAERLALRVTDQGCYVRVPRLEQLSSVTDSILALRPGWGAQVSVMFIVNPCAHTDTAKLAGRLRAFRHQVALTRRQGTALPLLLLSYFQTLRGEAPWFCWANGEASPRVREAGACVTLTDWQQQPADISAQGARMNASIQLSNAAAWLSDAVLPHFNTPDVDGARGLAVAWAIKMVPALPQVAEANLWQQWLDSKLALVDARSVAGKATLPFPDPLLNLIAPRVQRLPVQRASIVALWLFAFAGVVALVSSAWQNTLLVRQVSDDLHRFTSLPQPEHPDHLNVAKRQDALAVLRLAAHRLDTYYRHGAPLALGLGLYRGEHLRVPLLALLANDRAPSTPMLAQVPEPVRLDSLSLFSPGSARLKPDSTKVLVNALVGIKAQPGWLIVIAGHTDATGDALHNLRLSRARAAAVHDWMQDMGGIPDGCFAVQGFGASQPVASNDTEAGRAANRRVDIRLVPEAGACTHPTTAPDGFSPVASRDA